MKKQVKDIRNFGKIKDNFELPQLLDIQLKAYNEFLQIGVSTHKRKDQGLEEVFREVFPLESYDGRRGIARLDQQRD